MALNLRTLCAVLAIGVASAAFAHAQKPGTNIPEHPDRPVVVELFSSQGCGKCPDANRNLAAMALRGDVVALTYPVGYWDYLGWSDTFAKPEFTERQKRYNRALGHRGPYTPQVIYSGYLHGSGVNLDRIMEKFAVRDVTPFAGKVAFEADTINVSGAADKKASVMLVRFKPGTTKITPGGGANQGKPMTYYNLVTGIEHIGEWSGGEKKFKARCDSGCVVLLQQGGPEGAIVGVGQKK